MHLKHKFFKSRIKGISCLFAWSNTWSLSHQAHKIHFLGLSLPLLAIRWLNWSKIGLSRRVHSILLENWNLKKCKKVFGPFKYSSNLIRERVKSCCKENKEKNRNVKCPAEGCEFVFQSEFSLNYDHLICHQTPLQCKECIMSFS